jgi:hypothetical protein
MFPVRYELNFYTPEDGILHSDRCEDLKSYTFPISYELQGELSCSRATGSFHLPSKYDTEAEDDPSNQIFKFNEYYNRVRLTHEISCVFSVIVLTEFHNLTIFLSDSVFS